MIKDDCEAWKKYPEYHNWFNKLWLSERLRYDCGPCGTTPEKEDDYIVRPIYNLSGMGAGASVKHLTPDNYSIVPPGYFWCELFEGRQFSVTYEFEHDTKPKWNVVNSWEGFKSKGNLSKFQKWVRSDIAPSLPHFFVELSRAGRINVEFIEDKIIEVHLRESPDPNYDEIIPIWSGEENVLDKYVKMGYSYIKSFDDADGFLQTPRIGFAVK